MSRLWIILGVAVLGVIPGLATELSAKADITTWSVVQLAKAGQDALAAGDTAKAKTLAEAAVSCDAGYAGAWRLMGTVRLQAGETNSASQAFRHVLMIAPGDPACNQELAWLLWNDDREKAIACLDLVLQSNSSDRDALIRRVVSLLAEGGQDAKALELFSRWKPKFSLGELGSSLFTDGQKLAAYPFLDAAWQAGENRPEVGLYLAVLDSGKGLGSRVSACLKAFLAKAPAILPANQDACLWDSVLGATNDSVMNELWGGIERRYPADVTRRQGLAKRFEDAANKVRRRKDLDTAREFYRQAVILDPNRSCWADWILLQEKKFHARDVSQQLAELAPRVSLPVIKEAIAARMAHYDGDFETAIAGYRKSLALNPAQLTVRLFLVRDLLASSQLEEARHEVRLVDTLNEKTAERTRADMADFWVEVGDVLHALELDRNVLIDKSQASAAANDFEGALRMAVMAVTNDAANAEAWRQMGIVQFRLQKYGESRASLEKALAIKTNDVIARQELGWALWALGERQKARDSWDQAVALGVPDRERFVRQVVGRMVEDGQKDWALELHARWLPGVTPLATGLEFFRAGQMKAAEPFLTLAWDGGADRRVTGLYLGRVRSMNGVTEGTPEYFLPFISSCLATAATAHVAMVLDGLRVCSGVAGADKVLDAVAGALSNRQDQASAVTDVYLAYARDERDRGQPAAALAFYEKALSRDPDRLDWPTAWNLAVRISEVSRGTVLLSNLVSRTGSLVVRDGVRAKLAELRGDCVAARAGYEASIKADPSQADIHHYLFDVCLKTGALDEARHEADWMEGRVAAGETHLRDTLAAMWVDLGEDANAFELWRVLHLAMPDVPGYANEMAMAQYRMGKGREAVEMLKDSVRCHPTLSGYESLVQVLTALGRPVDAIEFARQGLALNLSPSSRSNLVESLQALQESDSVTLTGAATPITSKTIHSIEPLAKCDEKSVTAALIYDHVTPFDYAGMNTVSQMASHVAYLEKEGFILADAVPGGSYPPKAVIMILVNPDSAVVDTLEAALQANRGRVIVLVPPENLSHPVPRKPSPARWAELQKTGRWRAVATTQSFFYRDAAGFIVATPDLVRLPAKSVPSSWSAGDLIKHLRQDNPVAQARLEVAKLFYGNGQSEAASYWFRKAREAGANPFEVSLNEAANAAMEGDLPVALAKSRLALASAPQDDPRPAALLAKAEDMRRPTGSIRAAGWQDNEDRSSWKMGGVAEGPLRDALRWNAAVTRIDWEKQGMGQEQGTEADLGFIAYVAPEVWVKAGLQEWLMDTLPDETGWQACLHLPNPMMHGHIELTGGREMMDTVEALRKGITAHREGIEAYSRVDDLWDCFVDAARTERSDGNDTVWFDGRFVRRLKDSPYIGLGYDGQYADSTDKMPEYWSPQQLQQHQLYAVWRGAGVRWNSQVSGQAGVAKEQGTTWQYVWGARAATAYRLTSRLSVGGDLTYQSGPVYTRATVDAFLNFRW